MQGQQSLANFYQSVMFSNPSLAADIREDVQTVGIYGLVVDKTPAKDAADRLRRAALNMPVIHARVLDTALADLGF